MNKKEFKRKISIFFTYYQVYAILFALVITVASHMILNYLLSPKPFETISVFVVRKEIKEKSFQDDMLALLKDTSLRKVNVYHYNENDSSLSKHYDNFGKSSDLIFLPEKDLVDMKEAVLTNFISFDQLEYDEITSISHDCFYQYEKKSIALKVYGESYDDFSFSDYFTFSNTTYLLINKNSLHYINEKMDELLSSFLVKLIELMKGLE